MIVVGDREVEEERIAVRSLGGEDLGSMEIGEFAGLVHQ